MQINLDDLIASLSVNDPRGGKIIKSEVVVAGQYQALLLKCSDWIAEQLSLTIGSAGRRIAVPTGFSPAFNQAFEFSGPVPPTILAVVELLKDALSSPGPDGVDVAVALDWYKQPDDSGNVVNTQAGNWIYWTKHALYPHASNSSRARREMVGALCAFIEAHPLYASASAIVAAPGHKSDGRGFGEILAREVARRVDIPYVETACPSGERPQQKEEPQDLSEAFTVQAPLAGTVIALDDVFHTGQSASAMAMAARRAGAERVLSLTVARTIRR